MRVWEMHYEWGGADTGQVREFFATEAEAQKAFAERPHDDKYGRLARGSVKPLDVPETLPELVQFLNDRFSERR